MAVRPPLSAQQVKELVTNIRIDKPPGPWWTLDAIGRCRWCPCACAMILPCLPDLSELASLRSCLTLRLVRCYIILLINHLGNPSLARTSAATFFEWAKALAAGVQISAIQMPAQFVEPMASNAETMDHVQPGTRMRKTVHPAAAGGWVDAEDIIEGEEPEPDSEPPSDEVTVWGAAPQSALPPQREGDVDMTQEMTFMRKVCGSSLRASLTTPPHSRYLSAGSRHCMATSSHRSQL
jgi:hypothetical protein